MKHLGVSLLRCAPGRCESTLRVRPEHAQQDGYIHAGVMTAMADHTAGAAAATLIQADEGVLSVELKISLLRPGQGDALRCEALVIKPGRRLSFVESSVFAQNKLVAKLSATMAVVQVKA